MDATTRFTQAIISKRAELQIVKSEVEKLSARMSDEAYEIDQEDFMYQQYLNLHREALEKQIAFSKFELAKAAAQERP